MSAISLSILIPAAMAQQEDTADPDTGASDTADTGEDTGGEPDDSGLDTEDPVDTEVPDDSDEPDETGLDTGDESGTPSAVRAGEEGGFSCNTGVSLQSVGAGLLLGLALLCFRW